jgi:hypothetical protein
MPAVIVEADAIPCTLLATKQSTIDVPLWSSRDIAYAKTKVDSAKTITPISKGIFDPYFPTSEPKMGLKKNWKKGLDAKRAEISIAL